MYNCRTANDKGRFSTFYTICYTRASQPGPGGSPREELKIDREEICLGEELGRKNVKINIRVFCAKIKVK